MSQQPWEPPSRSGGGGGSVRRAREAMAARMPPGAAPPELPQSQQRPYDQSRPAPSAQASRYRPRVPAALQTKNVQPLDGLSISRPTQVPQWPLAAPTETRTDQRGNQQPYQPPAGRSVAPQRPPRPSRVPSMLDASRVQEHTPSFQYKPKQNPQLEQSQGRGPARFQDDDSASPITSPITQSSRPSTTSSMGTIPDFPIPMPPPSAQRRSSNLGPPPTSRRGASSYYSRASYVSPIPEESPRFQQSHGSYASSAAIPSSWGPDSPLRYEYGDGEREGQLRGDAGEEGRESRESNLDDSEDRGLIRNASVGKRAKPSMITTKSSDRKDPRRPGPTPQQKSKLERMGMPQVAAAGAVGAALTASRATDDQREPVWPMANQDSPLAGGTGLIDKSTSSSETEVPQVAKALTSDKSEAAPAYTTNPTDPRANAMLGAYNAASSLQPSGTPPARTPSPGFSRLSAMRRPPQLDIKAVRDAEARGSLTSLPDLIRRATKLAAMIDVGRRPASRLNDLSSFTSPTDLAKEKGLDTPPSEEKHQSGLSGMLAAFPPPGLATPNQDTTPRPVSAWPIADPSTPGEDMKPRSPKPRRCCGLPCWASLLVLLILLIVVAAAVVVPLELLVLHKSTSSTATALSASQQCQQNSATACQNGGTPLISSGSCACICINGFTGSTCAVAGATGCTTTTLSSSPSYSNVTLGDAIPRLISDSQANFSIPLFSTVILARFNMANLSCVSENALVTFDGFSQRVGDTNSVVVPTSTGSGGSSATSTSAKRRRNRDGSSSSSSTTKATDYPSSTSSSTYATAAASSSNASSAASTKPDDDFSVTEQVLDFARVAVLFVLQQEQLDAAVSAQSSLQHLFSLDSFKNKAAKNISLGHDNTVNLLDFSINLGNGSVGSLNSSVTSRSLGSRSIKLFK